jgi:hypothetical protein
MASKKQVEAKAAKLGGKLTITVDGAELQSPQGKHWDGYHNQVDYFSNDGKQAIWDAFWFAINNEEACDCDGTNTEARSAFQQMMEESRRSAEQQLAKMRREANVSGSK